MISVIFHAKHALRQMREQNGWTQEQVAAFLGTNAFTIYRWESGRAFPSPYYRQKLCELFGKNLKDLGLLPERSPGQQSLAPLPEPSLPPGSPTVYWYVPYRRNLFFTGREKILALLHEWLRPDNPVSMGVSLILSGLGGIGKTQLAIEYAYRHAREYSAIFWLDAASVEYITTSFLAIAAVLELPERQEADQQRVVQAVQRWFATHSAWLLIWDNLEDPTLPQRFLPSVPQGAVLITSRCQEIGTLARSIEVLAMDQEEGISLLLQRAKLLQAEERREQIHHLFLSMPEEYAAAQELVTIMGGLPLALDQARSYITETGCSLASYLRRYEEQRPQLLDRRGVPGEDHPQSVMATFLLASQRVAHRHPKAANLLRACAFLHAEAIPEELFVADTPSLERVDDPVVVDPYQFDLIIAALRTFSLVQRHTETRTLSLHRLVQAVVQEGMSEQEQAQWQQYTLELLNQHFPAVIHEAWRQCERLLPHVLTCITSLPNPPNDPALVEVLGKAADYLRERAQFEQAESLYQQALHIQNQVSDGENPQGTALLCSLASPYRDQGRYQQAEPLYQRALDTFPLSGRCPPENDCNA